MKGIRRAISAGGVGGATLVVLVFASAIQAASGFKSHERPLLTGSAAHQPAPRVSERLLSAPALHIGRLAKLDARLASLAPAQGRNAARYSPAGLSLTGSGRVRVIVEAHQPATLAAIVRELGGRVERTAGGLVQVVISRGALPALSQRPEVDFVRAPFVRVEHAVNGEEIAATVASPWHSKGFTGKGVKVAIIDGGFVGLPERQAAGELPSDVVTSDFCGGKFASETEHGTAVAEIVHEMAPEAQLYLLCVDTEVDLAAAVSFAKSQGVKIINHSMGWYGPVRGDGTGYVGSIVADARAGGILWVNSAGNEAETHWSGTYNPNGDDVHDWSPGDEGNTFLWPNESVICGFLKWDEWPAGVSDFDLALVLSGANLLIEVSDGYQTGSQPPFEALCMEQATGSDIYVYWAIVGYQVSTSPRLDLFSWSPPLQYQTAAGSITDPASSSSAFAVGALCWQSKQLEPYSSQGPTIDGRTKPDIAGHDSVSGSTYGMFQVCPSAFAGTSAASPEVAGAAALVEQAYPAYDPALLQQYLQRSARDLGSPGPDNATGAGELQLPTPPDRVPPNATALVSVGRRGTTMKLVSRVSDDSGEVQLMDQVKRNGRVISTVRRGGFVSASGPTSIRIAWKVPRDARGSYQHCVRATDRAGNTSPISCARLVLK